MFIYSLRASSIKFVGAVALSLVALIVLVAFVPHADDGTAMADAKGIQYVYSGIKTNDDRLKFLSQFDIAVEPEPLTTEEVKIPDTFDKVYLGYNEIQHEQGMDIAKYKNKKVTRYTYKVTNYEGYEGEVWVNLLIYRDKVIGGDVCSADVNGFVHGFVK